MSPEVDETYRKIRTLILREFPDITDLVEQVYGKVRVHLIDGSYLDIWLSRRIPGRFAYHWEHRHINGGIHRHDNRPHKRLESMKSFPKHFHNGSEENITESNIPDEPIEAVRLFLTFIRQMLRQTTK